MKKYDYKNKLVAISLDFLTDKEIEEYKKLLKKFKRSYFRDRVSDLIKQDLKELRKEKMMDF